MHTDCVPVTDSQEACLLKTDNTTKDAVPSCNTVHKTSPVWAVKGISTEGTHRNWESTDESSTTWMALRSHNIIYLLTKPLVVSITQCACLHVYILPIVL